MATQTFKSFKLCASLLEQETGIKYDAKPAKDVIAMMLDGYCKAMDDGDERLKSLYVSGLMMRFWYVIGKLQAKCPAVGLEEDDFASWLHEAIDYACKYRKWQVDPNVNAQQCLNQCIETIRKQHYYEFNLDKHKANFGIASMSAPLDDDGKTSLEDTIADEDETAAADMRDGTEMARYMVQAYLDRRKVVEAIILDAIAFNDTQRVTKKTFKEVDDDGEEYRYTKTTTEFWPFKVVQFLGKLPEGYEEYFKGAYRIDDEALAAAIGAIRKANNTKLYRFLDKTLKDAKSFVKSH